MAVITNLTTLTTAVTDYLARADLASFVPNFLQNCEERFYREPKNFGTWMENSLSVVLSNNVAAVPTSPRYLGLKIGYFSGYPPLKRLTLEQLYMRYPRGRGTAGVACF